MNINDIVNKQTLEKNYVPVGQLNIFCDKGMGVLYEYEPISGKDKYKYLMERTNNPNKLKVFLKLKI